jgi:hypothetical protein
MTMTPDRFQQLLDLATDTAPPAAGAGAEIAAGHRRLRRRRLAAAAGVVAAVAVVAGGAVVVTRGPDAGRAGDPFVTTPGDGGDAALLDSCRDGNQDRRDTDALFGAGTPVVKSVMRTDYQVVAALESADGAYWAECWVHLLSAEFTSGMTVYPSDPSVQAPGFSSTGTSYGTGSGCALVDGELQPDCPTWSLDWVDRLPAEVAAVHFILADGSTATIESHDGYVVLNLQNYRLGGVTYDSQGLPEVASVITLIRYLDAQGRPIAANTWIRDELGQPQPVDGLPELSAYPSVRGAAVG